jgi:hypothetical protein
MKRRTASGSPLADTLSAAEVSHPLCTETQGRRIVADMLNDAVEEAFGLALTGGSERQGREPAPGATRKPAANQ